MADNQNKAPVSYKQLECKPQYEVLTEPIKPLMHSEFEVEPIAAKGLTVGQTLKLVCKGEGLSVNPKNFKIVHPNDNNSFNSQFVFSKPKLIDSGSSEIIIEAKTYAAGKTSLSFLVEGDETNGPLEVKNLNLETQSLKAMLPKGGYFDPNEQPQEQEALEALQGAVGGGQGGKPFPALGNVKMQYPLYMWVGLAILICFILSILFAFYRRSANQRKLNQLWEEKRSPFGSHKDFHKTLRDKERNWYQEKYSNQEFLAEVYSELKLFFFREYRIDYRASGHSNIIRYFSKSKKSKKSRIRRLSILLEGISESGETTSEEDVKDYLRRSRELIDHLYMRGGL